MLGVEGNAPRLSLGGFKGGILFEKRIPPLYPPEKDEGRSPSTPDIASLRLEGLPGLRNGSAVYVASPRAFCKSLPISTAPYSVGRE